MSAANFLRGALLALLIGAPASAATPQRLAGFDVARAETWADALALCDLTAFLRTRPALEADVILSPDPVTEWARPLYGPRFRPPGLFFDRSVRLSFERLERAREVDRRAVGEARARHDRALFRIFSRPNQEEVRFLEEQSRLCAALSADIRTRYR